MVLRQTKLLLEQSIWGVCVCVWVWCVSVCIHVYVCAVCARACVVCVFVFVRASKRVCVFVSFKHET